VLTTLLSTQIVSADATLHQRYEALARNQLPRFRGEPVEGAPGIVSASFDGPARAIRCARAVVEAAAARGIAIQAGLHTGECAIVHGRAHGPAVDVGAAVAAAADPGEVLVSATVRDLVAGSGIALRERGGADGPGGLRLYSAGAAADNG
jgi:class 3 adenylate cyclase